MQQLGKKKKKKDFSICQRIGAVALQSGGFFCTELRRIKKNACPLLLEKLILTNVDKDF